MQLPEQIDHQPIINLIADKGVDYVSALQEAKISFKVSASSTSKYQFVESRDWGTGYYLINNEREAFYSFNEYNQSNEILLDLAEQIVPKSSVYHFEDREKDPTDLNITIDIRNEGSWTHNYEEEAYELIEHIEYTLQDHSKFVDYFIELEGSIISKTFQSSYSCRITQKYTNSYLTIELIPKIPGTAISLIENFGGITSHDLSIDIIENKIVNSTLLARKMEFSKQIKPNDYPIVLSPDAAYSLAHESIGHGVEADQIISGNSFLTNKMGRKVASTQITILDDPHIRGSGWAEYDDEGTKTKGTLLVEEGVLVDFLHNRFTANLLKMTPTGNARTTSYLTPPEPRQTNIFIEPKDLSLEEILENNKNGIYLGPLNYATTSIYTGEIVLESQFGYKIENGEFSELLLPITLAGNSIELLVKVNSVGSDLEKFPTNCLKESNKVQIGAYSPSLGIESHYLQ